MEKCKIWQIFLTAAAIIAGLWLGLCLLGPVLLPFGVGLLLARAAEPLTKQLCHRLPRWASAGISVAALYAVVILALFLICRTLYRELAGFAASLPALARSLTGPAQAMEQWLLELAGRFPDGIGDALQQSISQFFRSGAGLPGELYNRVFSLVSGLIKKVPQMALFLLTAILSSFMLAARLETLREFWRQKAPAKWRRRMQGVQEKLRQTFGGWLKAQLKLMSVTFLILTAGFLILRVDYPLLFGLVIALIDTLPVFGTGVILIPWGLVALVRGNTFLGIGLLCVYGAALLLRTVLEPRMLGRQIGLDPLWTLLALYAGHSFLGIPGMIVFPIGAILLKQFFDHAIPKTDPPVN